MGGLAAVRAAVDRGEWAQALDLLAACGPEATSAEGLELRAQAEYGNGGFEASVSAWEDLHSLLLTDGDVAGAARAAAMVAMFLMMDTGLMAPVRGWLRRAERLLEGHDEAPAHAVIAMVHAYERFMCGDMDAARRLLRLGDRARWSARCRSGGRHRSGRARHGCESSTGTSTRDSTCSTRSPSISCRVRSTRSRRG